MSEDKDGEPLGRGTQINIYLKDSCLEYVEEAKVKELVQRYSEFINFPIMMLETRTEEKEVPIEEDEAAAEKPVEEQSEEEKAKKAEEGVEVADEDEEEEKKPKTKKVSETITEWKALNDNQALWLRPPGNVSEEEYAKFYKALSKRDWEAPLAHTHFKAEGDVEFKAVMFVPPTAPHDLYDNYYGKKPSVKLYVRRVFISDSFEDLLPKWLSFLVGLVDSDTMPLNVSREMLQLHEGLKVIKKKLVRKAIDMIKKLADAESKARKAEEEDKAEDAAEQSEEEKKAAEAKKEAADKASKDYTTFYTSFGKSLKMGIIEDTSNRRRLLPLLRFHSSKSPDKLVSLADYAEGMKEGQKHIYYLVGSSKDEVAGSPFVESLVEKGYEVLYMTDPLDEYVMQNVHEYEDKEFANVSKDDLKLAGKDDQEKKREKKQKEEFKGLAKWWKEALGSAIENVKVSKRLATTPCVVVSSKYGWSATMERIARSQTLGDQERAKYMRGQRSLEINPRHPLIVEMKAQHDADAESPILKERATLLYQTCLLESGFMLEDAKEFNTRVFKLLAKDMGVGVLTVPKEEAQAEDAEEEEEPAKAEEAEAAAAEDVDSEEAEDARDEL